jgi:hypothetical protein
VNEPLLREDFRGRKRRDKAPRTGAPPGKPQSFTTPNDRASVEKTISYQLVAEG